MALFSMMREPRANSRKHKTRLILSVPMSPEQMAQLAHRAGGKPLSAYTREQLFPANDNTAGKIVRPRSPMNADFAAKVLASIGPVATALHSIAHGIASGLLPYAPDTEAAVLKACADIVEMKAVLLKALGIRER